jgi:hypothetical protein
MENVGGLSIVKQSSRAANRELPVAAVACLVFLNLCFTEKFLNKSQA